MIIPYIHTFTGKIVNPLDVLAEDICIEDIAHHLSQVSRYGGAAKRQINVAQHSVYVSRLCRGKGFAVERQGLFHDASEAYLGDVTKWLKASPEFDFYRKREKIIQDRIYVQFHCSKKLFATVEEADKIMVLYEIEQECGGHKIYVPDGSKTIHPDYPKLTESQVKRIGHWRPWSIKESEEAFLVHYEGILDRERMDS